MGLYSICTLSILTLASLLAIVAFPVAIAIRNPVMSEAVSSGKSRWGQALVFTVNACPPSRTVYLKWCEYWHVAIFVEVMEDSSGLFIAGPQMRGSCLIAE